MRLLSVQYIGYQYDRLIHKVSRNLENTSKFHAPEGW